jgi:hypothetical protein
VRISSTRSNSLSVELGICGAGLRVHGLRFGVQTLAFRVQGSGVWPQRFGFRVPGFMFGVWG